MSTECHAMVYPDQWGVDSSDRAERFVTFQKETAGVSGLEYISDDNLTLWVVVNLVECVESRDSTRFATSHSVTLSSWVAQTATETSQRVYIRAVIQK